MTGLLQEKRYSQGDIREDGLVFLSYRKVVSGFNERWLTPEAYERYKRQCRSWHKKDPERARLQTAKWRAANPEKVKESYKRSREKFRESRNAYHAKYVKRNAALFCHYAGVRRALKRKTATSLTEDEKTISKAIYGSAKRISECLGIQHHVDHVIPLSKGGEHRPSNFQILPASVNQKKYNKLPA